MLSKRKPFLLIVSGPSGSGKTSIIKSLFNQFSGLALSISHTTRSPRVGERDGSDYYFISNKLFEEKKSAGDFVESAYVYGFYYGTSISSILQLLTKGVDVVLDIDVQGMQTIVASGRFDLVSVFIMPPSMDDLELRLRTRGTDSDEVIQRRLVSAESEISLASAYDYIIVNRNLDDAAAALVSIVSAERHRTSRFV